MTFRARDADSADDGPRINSAAGLAISVGLQDQIDGMTQAAQNAGTGDGRAADGGQPDPEHGHPAADADPRGPGRRHRQPDTDIAQGTTKLAEADSQLLARADARPQTLVQFLLG